MACTAGTKKTKSFLLTPLREGRHDQGNANPCSYDFYSRPCGRGDVAFAMARTVQSPFLLTPLREGRLCGFLLRRSHPCISTHAPAGGATGSEAARRERLHHFYSRPCGRGDVFLFSVGYTKLSISTHAPAGGATAGHIVDFNGDEHFYSRPCGRGDCNFPQVRHEVLRQIAER